MNISGDAAESVMRISLEGFEVIAKLTGTGAKELFLTIYAILKDNDKQSVGKTNLINMMRNCKDIKIFSMPLRDLEKFTEESKKYGIKYCTLLDKEDKTGDSIVDVMVRSEDAVKVNRIVERYNLAIADTAVLRTEEVPEVDKNITDEKEEEKTGELKQENNKVSDEQIDDILGEKDNKQDEQIISERDNGVSQPFLEEDNQLENSLKNKGVIKENEKVSVKKTLREIKEKLNNDSKEENTAKTRKEKSKKNKKKRERGVKNNGKNR